MAIMPSINADEIWCANPKNMTVTVILRKTWLLRLRFIFGLCLIKWGAKILKTPIEINIHAPEEEK